MLGIRHASDTFGGRRIEDPLGGGTVAHPHLAQGVQGKDLSRLGVLGVAGFLGILGVLSVKRPLRRNEPRNGRKFGNIVPRTLQNRGPGPPKSSPEPSKTPFFKDLQLKRVKMGNPRSFWRPKLPTWLQVGGPRPSKIEAKTRKNRC